MTKAKFKGKGRKMMRQSLRENIMVNPRKNLSLKRVVAPTFRTNMNICWLGTTPATAAANDYFSVSCNSLHIPFNSALAAGIRTVNSVAMTPTVGEVYSTVQCSGYTNICGSSALYSRYRVYSSRIRVSAEITNGSDTLLAVVNTVNSGTGPNTAVWTAASAPNASKIRCYGLYKPDPAITCHVKIADLWGVDREAITTDDGFSANATSSPTNESVWVINWQNCARATMLGLVMWTIQVEYDVEFFGTITGNLPDTFQEVSESSTNVQGNIIKREEEDYLTVNGSHYVKLDALTPSSK